MPVDTVDTVATAVAAFAPTSRLLEGARMEAAPPLPDAIVDALAHRAEVAELEAEGADAAGDDDAFVVWGQQVCSQNPGSYP